MCWGLFKTKQKLANSPPRRSPDLLPFWPFDRPHFEPEPSDLHLLVNLVFTVRLFFCPMMGGLVSPLYWLGQPHSCAKGIRQSAPRVPHRVSSQVAQVPKPHSTVLLRPPLSFLVRHRRHSASLLAVRQPCHQEEAAAQEVRGRRHQRRPGQARSGRRRRRQRGRGRERCAGERAGRGRPPAGAARSRERGG